MTPLVTLQKYQEAVGSTENPHVQLAAIEDASAAVLNWTDRDFASEEVTEEREYRYDGSGILDIDDCHTITAVKYNGTTISENAWVARREGPTSVPVYSYLELVPFVQETGQMGFTYNLDVFLDQYPRAYREITVAVAATFGWPTVPDDVQRATIWTAANFEQDPSAASGAMTGKSVAEVSETWAAQAFSPQVPDEEPIPSRARALLWPYRRG